MTDAKKLKYRYFFLSFAVAFLVLSLVFWVLMQLVHPRQAQALAEAAQTGNAEPAYVPTAQDALTVLFIGMQNVGTGNAGTYVLARFDPAGGRVPIVSFPAETLVQNGTRQQTLAEVYKYGGAEHTRRCLAQTLGIAIDRYVRMDVNAFIACAAAIGSVEYDLPQPLTIGEGGMRVVMQQGRQLLDGKKVADMIRYDRYEGGELTRCEQTTALAAAIVNQRMDIALSTVIDSIFSKIVNAVDTNISYPDYDSRKQAAAFLARLGQEPAVALAVSGQFNEDETQYTLTDTFTAMLTQYFA